MKLRLLCIPALTASSFATARGTLLFEGEFKSEGIAHADVMKVWKLK